MQRPLFVKHKFHIFISATHFRIYIIRPTAISAIILGK